MDTLLLIYIVIVGLCFGSYYNVVALRGLEGRSIVKGRSECVTCNRQIKLYDLFPILSFLLLAGKCRYCGSRISPIYMVGEAGTAIAFAFMYIQFGLSPDFFIGIVFASLIIISIITDIKERLILDKFTFPALGILFALQFIFHTDEILQSVIGALVMFVTLTAVNVIKKDAIGGGDIKLFLCIGTVLGLKLSLVTLFLASILGLLVYLPLYLMKKSDNTLPFAPFIGVAAMFTFGFQHSEYLINLFTLGV